jgi:indolepyruvate ferredoxin oxidoreductase beta subunit
VETYPEGIEETLRIMAPSVRFVDPEQLVEAVGEARVLNVALLGILSGLVQLPEEVWRKALEERIPKGYFDLNWKAFQVGRQWSGE